MKNADKCWVYFSNSPFGATSVENGKVIVLGVVQARIENGNIITTGTVKDGTAARVRGDKLNMHIIPVGKTDLTIAGGNITAPGGKAVMGYNPRCSVQDAGLGAAVSIMTEQRGGGRIKLK